MPNLIRTRLALEDIKEFVDEKAVEPAILSYMAQYVVVCFYSEMESRISEILKTRMQTADDPKLTQFLQNCSSRVIRTIRKNEIAEVLKFFGNDIVQEFDGIISESEITFYSNAINGRHSVAHGGGATVTIQDMEKAVDAGDKILDAFSEVIQ